VDGVYTVQIQTVGSSGLPVAGFESPFVLSSAARPNVPTWREREAPMTPEGEQVHEPR